MVSVPAKYRNLLRRATTQAGIPYEVGAEQINVESGFDPNVTSPTGAEGIAQFEPGTWAGYGEGGNPYNPRDAFPAYGRYMQALMYDEGNNLRKALAAYNAGPGNLQAGYGYADEILGAAHVTTRDQLPYRNPLRGVQNLRPDRIDMGVDYSGSGPIYALGPGVITNTQNTGWPGGAFIGERLTSGPLAGHYVYAAENIQPTVQVGQHVTSDTQIGELTGGSIETGFAAPPGTGDALGASQFYGENPTAYGAAYSKLLSDLGAPPGTASGPVTGSAPSWLRWIGGVPIFDPTNGGKNTGGGLLGIPQDIVRVFQTIEHDLEWWAAPSNWFRIFAGIAGTGLVVYGVVTLARPRINLPVLGSTPVVPGGELGPALGIVSVTTGAILLFFAFHNTGVASWPDFLKAIRDKLHGQPIPSGVGPPGSQGGLVASGGGDGAVDAGGGDRKR